MLLRLLLYERCFLSHVYFAVAEWARGLHLIGNISVVVATISQIRVETWHCDTLKSMVLLIVVLLDLYRHIQIMVMAQNLPALDITATVNHFV